MKKSTLMKLYLIMYPPEGVKVFTMTAEETHKYTAPWVGFGLGFGLGYNGGNPTQKKPNPLTQTQRILG